MNHFMNYKRFLGLLVVATSTLICQSDYAQTPQAINKTIIPNSNSINYYTALPFFLHLSAEKNILLSLTFSSDPQSGALTGIKGFDLFAKGVGKCFFEDTLEIIFENGSKMKLGTANPKICDEVISGWIRLPQEKQDTLFSDKIRQINYHNGESKESTTLDITDNHDKEFFLEVKKIYDTMVPAKKEGQ